MDRNRSLLWPVILVTIACILVVEVGCRLLRHSLVNATATLRQHSAPTIATAGRKSGGLAGQQIILARNLFAAKPGTGEKSHGEASDGGGVTQSGVLEVVLLGTVEDSAGTSRAVFLDKKSGRQQLYRQGDKIQAGRIEEIGRGRVVVREGERRRVFDLGEAGKYRAALAAEPEKEQAASEKPRATAMPTTAEAVAPIPASENGGGEAKARRSFRLQRAAKATP